ncbi:MarR family transcriptional regulator [Leptospira gomenensis]|uniref:MarR family transcriptional regulator n=1 Tax=Leptospira gomenensis TaxID=2484974 RepID=A0A5F1YS75_9LEPT|nr:MarR family transcriptional regulator [Leptospira gomenensis]TGK28000.1 MarR family transcriptional regulator [Leptospira gomenensis]TGK37145.1 MarR family transcriptional regulator [Leptospira gomenensis]TGK45781.1 MarR family transcriptional regulator [Leptospira gomenensis]TGK59720.1 MarR family transcriptional regulator [Leptospira gomenensis]
MFVLDKQLGFNLHRVALLFRRELSRCLRDYNLTPEQWQVLAALWEKESLTQKEIIHITLQDAPSASRMIARMVQKDLVKSETSKEDKRATLITLTKTGKSYEKILPKKILSHFETLLNDFSERKKQTLLDLLKELRIVFGDFNSPPEGIQN